MYYKLFAVLLFVIIIAGCGKTEKESAGSNENKQTFQPSGKEVSVEIQTSGMTCTGCESTIKKKVKKLNGVKEVTADFQTNTVKATYDDGLTNIEEIKKAISSAGYSVESVKQ